MVISYFSFKYPFCIHTDRLADVAQVGPEPFR